MILIEQVVLILKIVFILSAFIKVMTPEKNKYSSTELKISRFLYYNASLLLFFYWFNPFSGKICLEGEEKLLVFSFALIEGIEEILDQFYPHLL
jgi:hypothetical protein